jgi:hypothetical protein
MRCRSSSVLLFFALLFLFAEAARASHFTSQKKEYLTESEADKIRDAPAPGDRIKLFLGFAEDRLKKFQYELNRQTPDRRRGEMLNSLLNAYAGCVDDAADQIGLAQEKQADIRSALKLFLSKGKEFLETLDKVDRNAADFESYKDTLDDAVEGTKDALADAEKADKETSPAPVRRKP